MAQRILIGAVMLAMVSMTAGCLSFGAADRGILADPMMSFDPQEDPSAGQEAGVYAINYMENSTVYAGGSQGASSGCPSCK